MNNLKQILPVVGWLLCAPIFAQEGAKENDEPQIGEPMIVEGLNKRAPSKEVMIKEITAVYALVFPQHHNWFDETIDFKQWSETLTGRVNQFVEKHGDKRTKSILKHVDQENQGVERAIDEAFRASHHLTHENKKMYSQRFAVIQKYLAELLDELGAIKFDKHTLFVQAKKDAKEVLNNFALHVQNIAITAAKHLAQRKVED